MANEQAKSTPEALDVPYDKAGNIDYEQLGNTIATAVAKGISAESRRTVKFGEYLQRQNAGREKMTVVAFQNDRQIDAGVLSNAEILLLNSISRSGRYFDRKVEVIYQTNGIDRVVYFRYNNKSTDDRFDLRGYFRNLTEMLKQIVAEQAVENEEEEAEKAAVAEIRKQGRKHLQAGKSKE
jgi:hypothetical protein